MNRVNILTALDRVAKFKEAHLRRHTQPVSDSKDIPIDMYTD
jgi:hypothetical protein